MAVPVSVAKKSVDSIFAVLAEGNPHPQTELDFTNNYTLLVAVVLSAQATDVGVNKATKVLFQKISTPEQMVKLSEEGLKRYIKTIGLYNAKAKNIIALSERLIERHHGEVPDTLEALQALPGVGRKTANVVLNCAFGVPTIAVDTHVFRVSHRMGLAKGSTPEQVEQELLKIIPKRWQMHAHHWLILHGRYVCMARAPLCGECTIRQWCAFKGKTV